MKRGKTRGRCTNACDRSLLYGITMGGSAEHLLKGQLRWMANRYRVSLVCNPDDAARRAAAHEGVPLYGIPMRREPSIGSDLKALVSWIRLLRSMSPDIVNVSTPKAALLGGLAAWFLRIKRRIYVVRGLRFESATGIRRRLLKSIEVVSMWLATDIIFVSHSAALAARRERLIRARTAWVIGSGSSNGVDSVALAASLAHVDPLRVRSAWGIAPECIVVGYIGRITPDKGVSTLVDAMKDPRLPTNVVLVAIGAIEDHNLELKLRSLGTRAVVLPPVADISPILRGIDILCLPTLREGFPNVVLEAACAGVPAITTRATGAVDSVLDDETGLLFDVGDVNALVDAITRLTTSSAARTRLGEAAKRRAQSEFRPERIWSALADLMDHQYSRDLHPV